MISVAFLWLVEVQSNLSSSSFLFNSIRCGQSWKASQKPKNLGCKKLKAENWKKFWWWKRKAKSFIFLQLSAFCQFFLIFDEKESQSWKVSRKLKNFGCKKLKAEKKWTHENVESQKFYHQWRSQKPKAEVLSYSFPALLVNMFSREKHVFFRWNMFFFVVTCFFSIKHVFFR